MKPVRAIASRSFINCSLRKKRIIKSGCMGNGAALAVVKEILVARDYVCKIELGEVTYHVKKAKSRY